MDSPRPQLRLRVPTPDRHNLSFCDGSLRDLRRWVAGLPKANIGETARQLYQALVELNQLQCASEQRLQMLELLRPEIHFVCQHLERHFIGQAIVLDERPRKVANLCQALQNHLAIGYKLIVSQALQEPSNRQRDNHLLIALQRAIRSLTAPLVRASQLYCPVPEGLWLELHQLYQIASQAQLAEQPVSDGLARHGNAMSCAQSYLVALLLGCARTNQMRQSGIARLAEILEAWSLLARLLPASDSASLFAIAPQQDGPPRFKSLFGSAEQQHMLGLDTHPLADSIKEHLLLPEEERHSSRLLVPAHFSVDMLQHLAAAWGDIAERTFQRNQGQGQLTLCIGMSALHYYLGERKTLAQQLKRPEVPKQAVFASDAGAAQDIWGNAFDAQPGMRWDAGLDMEEIQYQPAAESEETGLGSDADSDEYPVHELPIVNHSPGGYCLSWPREVPSQLQTGELLGIQDMPGRAWTVAVVRWIRQVRGGGTQMGIELIAPQAQPCGLQLIRKQEQNSQYLRALLLPEIRVISRPASLITPRLPFQEGSKVQLNLQGEEHRATLGRRLCATGSFSQFQYRLTDAADHPEGKPVTSGKASGVSLEEDFDSLWKSL